MANLEYQGLFYYWVGNAFVYLTRGFQTFIFHLPEIISINLLATDFFFQILAHPVFKMWVIQKPNKVKR